MNQIKNPFVSIIIPAFNAEKYIERALLSVANQNFANCEIVIVNDGSTDATLNIATAFFEKHLKLKSQIITIENAGLANARNIGIKAAVGEYFINLDADDFLADQILYRLKQENSSKNYDICIYGFIDYNEHKQKHENPYTDRFEWIEEEKIGIECAVLKISKRIWICQGSACYKRTMVVENNIWNVPGLNQGEDLYFITKALMFSKSVCCVPVIGVNIAYREDSMMHSAYNESYLQTYKIYEKLLCEVRSFPTRNVEQKLLLGKYVMADYYSYQLTMAKKIVKCYNLLQIKKAICKINSFPKVPIVFADVVNYLSRMKRFECRVYNKSLRTYFILAKFILLCKRIKAQLEL